MATMGVFFLGYISLLPDTTLVWAQEGRTSIEEPEPSNDRPLQEAADESLEHFTEAQPVIWLEQEVEIQSTEIGPVILPPGLYAIEPEDETRMVLIAKDGEAFVTVTGQPVASTSHDYPYTAYVTQADEHLTLRITQADGHTVAVPVKPTGIRSRGLVVYAKPDLTGSMRAPSDVNYDVSERFTITVRNDGTADASTIRFRVYTEDQDGAIKALGTLVSPTSGTFRCSQGQGATHFDCIYDGTIARGTSRNFTVNVKPLRENSSNYLKTRKLELHVDCSDSAVHGQGGTIRESNESNNVSHVEFQVRELPDLSPGAIRGVYSQTNGNHTPKNKMTRVSVKVIHDPAGTPYGYPPVTSGIKAVATFNMYTILAVRSGHGNFDCSFSNSTKKVTCVAGQLPSCLTRISATGACSTYTREGTIMVDVVPLASAPIGPTPVTLSIDPDGRITEQNERNNFRLTSINITN